MAVNHLPPPGAAPGQQRQARVPNENRYLLYHLNDSIAVAQSIRDQGGGSCSPEHLAGFLHYSGTNNGAYITRIGAARAFGLIQTNARQLMPTQLAHSILSPEYTDDARAGRAQAFLNVPLYRAIFQRYRPQGGQLPAEAGLRHVLQTQFGIPTNRTGIAYRVLMDSAEQAGFFEARGGARTHLVMPLIHAQPGGGAREPSETTGSDGGGVPPTMPPPPTEVSLDQVHLEYVRKLISLLGTEAVDHKELMDRIERLLHTTVGTL